MHGSSTSFFTNLTHKDHLPPHTLSDAMLLTSRWVHTHICKFTYKKPYWENNFPILLIYALSARISVWAKIRKQTYL